MNIHKSRRAFGWFSKAPVDPLSVNDPWGIVACSVGHQLGIVCAIPGSAGLPGGFPTSKPRRETQDDTPFDTGIFNLDEQQWAA